MSDRIQKRIHQVLDFSFFERLFIAASISFCVIDLFRWLISSLFNFWWSYVSRNLSISSRFSNLLEYRFSSSLQWFPGFPWCLLLSPLLHFWFYWFGFFLSHFSQVRQGSVNLFYFFKELPFCFIDSLYGFFMFLFHWFQLLFLLLSPSIRFGICLFFFF
jgi:hypothetical protein